MIDINSVAIKWFNFALGVVALLVTTACAVTDTQTAAGQLRTTWDRVYTLEQAARGQKLVEAQCAVCHGKNLHGSRAAPAIAGLELLFVWDGRTLDELLEYMRTSMPPGQVGTIDDQDFVDIMATILHASGFPSGNTADLSALTDSLERTVIKREQPE